MPHPERGRLWKGKLAPKNRQYIYPEERCIINDICINPFSIPHDASEPVGYNIEAENHKITIATDLGHITKTIKESIFDSEILLLEANHDEQMVKNSSYPYELQERILGKQGHLSNKTAGNLLCDVISEKLSYVFLGHLSEENNSPNLAYKTVKNILQKEKIQVGKQLQLEVAPRNKNSSVITL